MVVLACTHRESKGKTQIYITKHQVAKWFGCMREVVLGSTGYPIAGTKNILELRAHLEQHVGDDFNEAEAWTREHLGLDLAQVGWDALRRGAQFKCVQVAPAFLAAQALP